MKSKAHLFFLSFFLLAGCQTKPHPFSYYMLHPEKIQKELDACHTVDVGSPDCIAAVQAAEAVNGLLDTIQSNPEGFGLKIMHLQIALAKVEQKIQTLQNTHATNQKMLDTLLQDKAALIYQITVYQRALRLMLH